MPTLYPGALDTAPTPWFSIDAMWLSFLTMATNKTPAICGENYFSLPPLAGLSLQQHAGSRSQSRSAAPSSRSGHVGSSHNPVVMSVAHADHYESDPFSHTYNHWPADSADWDTVFQVSASFNNKDPPLWTTLTSPEARTRAFRDNRGLCLNCHGTDHSLKFCSLPFANRSGCLNPQLGTLGDNGDAYRRWQQRMRSHRSRNHSVGGENTRSSSTSDRRKNSSRHQNNNRSRSNGGNTHAPPRNNWNNNGQGNYNQNSPNSGNNAPLQLGQDARNTGSAPQSLTVYQPNQGTPPAPASAAGTPGIRYGASHNSDKNNPNARHPGTFRSG